MDTAGLQPLPNDIRTCPTNPPTIPEGALNAGQIEVITSKGIVTIRKLNNCLRRVIVLWDGARAAGV